ncbi:MAG: fumarylacetoacetate hydrolase family protein [Bdellovibrionaceae bacterium]|nr:fumarylacetoacetate hydrolase family protein [Pseudobdellovibrionaceae bacterium]NUM57867.1 fumarylacetoacetate hydrolase family protein [Pseudobdellovibrionaceae bacterium]
MTIWCVGRNFAEHAKELGNEVPQEPLFFIKSPACLHLETVIPYPSTVKSLHFELEIALSIDESLRPDKVALALDLTDRVQQNESKTKGHPWSLAKSFKNACPLSPWTSFNADEDYSLELLIDGQTRQKGSVSEMTFKPEQLLAYLKLHFPVQPGDILLTGTPSGVGELKKGQALKSLLKSSKQQILIEWNTKIE